jgi:heme exporter protein A
MLTIFDIEVYHYHKKIFSQVGFSLPLGCCLLIKGANGIGKTSLLKAIAGICHLEKGEIFWQKQNIKKILPSFQQEIKFIGHKNFFKPQLSVLENLMFYSKLTATEITVPMAMHFFNLTEICHYQIGKLSAGWQQRCLLALLLTYDANLWLLDEPTKNLDMAGKQQLKGLIKTKIMQNGIVIIATHTNIFDDIGQSLFLQDFAR